MRLTAYIAITVLGAAVVVHAVKSVYMPSEQSFADSTGEQDLVNAVSGTLENHSDTVQPDQVENAAPQVSVKDLSGSRATAHELSDDEVDVVTFRGNIQTEYGAISVGETVNLYSRKRNQGYSVTSDSTGSFSFEQILAAEDYRLSVAPKGMFERLTIDSVSILESTSGFTIFLKPLALSTLTGVVKNQDGVGIADYQFTLKSLNKAKWRLSIETDDLGEFRVENVPLGRLEFTKTYGQALLITGHDFQENQAEKLELIVDEGSFQVSGFIYDQYNNPVSGATVVLDWEHTSNAARSTAIRQVTTDPSGRFLIENIGRGAHSLLVTALEHQSFRTDLIVGVDSTDFTIVLPAI
ncbi:MAG: carboxypeptidase-like regulatory domain-containing protein [Pseudomonadota bacterium]